MKRIIKYMLPHWTDALAAILFAAVQTPLALILSRTLSRLIDAAVPSGDALLILKFVLALAGLLLLWLLCTLGTRFFSLRFSCGFGAHLRRSVFAQALASTGSLHEETEEDLSCLETGAAVALCSLPLLPILTAALLTAVFQLDSGCGAALSAFAILLWLLTFVSVRTSLPMKRHIRKMKASLEMQTRDAAAGAQTLRMFGCEEGELDAFELSNTELSRLQKRQSRLSALIDAGLLSLTLLALTATLAIGAARLSSGTLSIGDLAAILIDTAMLAASAVWFKRPAEEIIEAVACALRLSDLLGRRPAVLSPTDPVQPNPALSGSVKFEHVRMKYVSDGPEALSDLNFSVRSGEIIGVLGGMSAGKSTLAGLIERFYDASAGFVRIDGADVRLQELKSLRARVALVPQGLIELHGSLREALLEGVPDAPDSDLLEALKLAQAQDVLKRVGGLDGSVEALTSEQCRRIVIARALMCKSEILILDESFVGMDQSTEARLRMALRTLEHRPTVFILSRQAACVRFTDRIIVLEDGKMVGMDTHDALLNGCPIYREFLDAELHREV